MADYSIFDSGAGKWSSGETRKDAYAYQNGGDVLGPPTYANNPTPRAAMSNFIVGAGIDLADAPWPPDHLFTGEASIARAQLQDYRWRLWVLPSTMTLNNPRVGIDIPFRIWNTNPYDEQIVDIDVDGSEVLTFDIDTDTVFYPNQYALVNMQIGSGEATIDADITFETTNLFGYLTITAVIIDTFNVIPDVPVEEEWNFLTDIIENYKGDEQRISLRRYPRIMQKITISDVTEAKRREIYTLLARNLVVSTILPSYQYGTVLTQSALAGATRLYFDPARTNLREGEYIVLINTTTEDVVISRITTVESDGVTMASATPVDLEGTWVLFPAIVSTFKEGAGILWKYNSADISVTADSFNEPALLRPNATRVIDTFDDLPWVNRRPINNSPENFYYTRSIMDNETGARSIASRQTHPKDNGSRTFNIQRVNDPDEMDYWRSLFDTIRGAQKPFLMSTWASDLTVVEGFGAISGASQISVNEAAYYDLFWQYDTWKRIEIQFPGGERTQHVVTSATPQSDGTLQLIIDPAIPDTTNYDVASRISFLVKRRATDRVALKHYAMYSELSFGVYSTDT
jgi:hypothetical protein